MVDYSKAANARSLFTDDLSLRVFDARLKLGKDVIREAFPETLEIVNLSEATKLRLMNFIEEIRNTQREKFIYGAGLSCSFLLEKGSHALGVSQWDGIIDNHVTGKRYGLPVVTFTEFINNHKDALVLNSVGYPVGSSIHKQCIDADINCESLFEIDNLRYFDLPKEMDTIGDGEVFVHAGCYNGDTQKNYVNCFGDTYAKMITFEPNVEQFAVSKERLNGLRDMEIVQAGLSDKNGVVRLALHLPASSFISETGGEEIRVVTLDEFMGGGEVTFIALDIEGGELAAIRGAERIIRTQKPKLAISVYHKPEDIWELPFQIKEYNPAYRFYMRHYHLLDMAETVLYAL